MLPPDGYLLVFLTDDEKKDGELHADFRLPSEGGTIWLLNAAGEAACVLTYDDLPSDWSLMRQEDGSYVQTDAPSPGQPNTVEGTLDALDISWTRPIHNRYALFINEVMTSVADSPDWVELYNDSAADIDLSGFGLSNDPHKPREWQFPEGTTIPAGGYLLVALAGKDADPEKIPAGRIAADFALSVEKTERLQLSDASGQPIDRMLLTEQVRSVSYGRVEGWEEYGYLSQPSPGRANTGNAFLRAAREIAFSQEGGPQEAPFELTLTSSRGIPIYYTTDGSLPSAASNRYTGPIPISGNTVVRAVAWQEGALSSPLACRTFLFDVETGNTARIVCVSGDPEEMTGENAALNTSVPGSGSNVHAEIYDRDGEEMISQACYFRLNGSGSLKISPQKPFRLVAERSSGDTRFRARLFDSLPYDSYKAVVLRCGGQDNRAAFIRDRVLTSLAQGTHVLYQEAETACVYINGQYWGFYFMRERAAKHMICQHHDWPSEDVDQLEIRKLDAMIQGSGDHFDEMMAFVKKNGVKTPGNLQKLRRYMDVENYLDYVMLEMYTDNQDLNNSLAYRNPNGDGLWRWFFFDQDLAFHAKKDPVAGWFNSSGKVGTVTRTPNTLFVELMKNPTCRDYFLTRFGEMLAGPLSSANVTYLIDATAAEIEDEMRRSCERWEMDFEDWEKYVATMRRYAEKETTRLIDSLTKQFKLSDEEKEKYFGKAIQMEARGGSAPVRSMFMTN